MGMTCDCLSPQELRIQNKDDKRAGRERVFKIMDTFMHSVPANPARNFYKAIQSQWFVPVFSRIE